MKKRSRKPKSEQHKISPAWKDFEDLVARIEGALGPEGAVVKHPDHIPDKDTGQLREVDASIRFMVGSVPILITVECRRRGHSQDARWIEELYSKKASVGAQQTIAVSAKGFSKPALMKAARLGIEVRRIEDITTKEIANWTKEIPFTNLETRYRCPLPSVFFARTFVGETPSLSKEVVEEFGKAGLSAEILVNMLDGSKWSIESIILKELPPDMTNVFPAVADKPSRLYMRPKDEGPIIISSNPFTAFLYKDVPQDGTRARRKIELGFPRGIFQIATTQGMQEIVGLRLAPLDLWQIPSPFTFSRNVAYRNESKAITYAAQTQPVEWGKTGGTLMVTVLKIEPENPETPEIG